jgi:ABC-type amino acid transport system permease subunit
MMQIVVDPFITSVVALTTIMMVIVSDMVKNALGEFPAQYILSAKACGLNSGQIIRKIQLPIIFRQLLPNLLFAMVTVLQASLFASMIGVNEIFRVAQQINSDIYKPVEIYTALAIFFIAICAALNLLAFWLKSKLKWSFSEV